MSLEIGNSTAPSNNNGKTWFEEMRGWIMIVAVQVAAATYASGLNPPGGFWPDDNDGHIGGYAILHDKSKRRYTTFYYANATAFMASLVVIVLLSNRNFYRHLSKVVVLYFFVVLGLISLILAYAAGSARRVSTSIYVIVLAVGVSLLVIFSANVVHKINLGLDNLCPKWRNMTTQHDETTLSELGKDDHTTRMHAKLGENDQMTDSPV